MGVLNLTPDSFSDGGQFFDSNRIDTSAVVDTAAKMVADGADWLDLGGESTRPGATPVAEEEELNRVIPALEALRARFDVPISIDTSTAAVMSESIELGATMINDVRALSRAGAIEAVARSNVCLCLMHMQGDPESMQDRPNYENVVEQVRAFLSERLDALTAAGISEQRVYLDPGFGFGKTLEHNLELLHGLNAIRELGRPILVGLSNKSMIGAMTDRDVDQRLPGTIALNTLALTRGASILRVHNVAAAVDTIKIWNAYSTTCVH